MRLALVLVLVLAAAGLLFFLTMPELSAPPADASDPGGGVTRSDHSGAAVEEAELTAAPRSRPATEEAPAPVPVEIDEPARRTMLGTGSLELRIVDETGRPAASARCVLVREGAAIEEGASDSRGAVRFPATGDTAFLLVAPLDRGLHVEAIELLAGTRDVHLPPGRAVAGVAVLDGGPPGEPIEMRLDWNEPSLQELGLPAKLAARVAERTDWQDRSYGVIGPNGAFRIDGLPERWSGTLSLEKAYQIEDAGGAQILGGGVYVPGPREDLVLAVRRRPALRGRVLLPGGEPAGTEGAVALSVSYADNPRGATGWQVSCDERGRFEAPLSKPEVIRVHLKVRHPDHPGEEFWFEPPPAHLDLGDLLLPATRRIRFRVEDLSGEAVPGAIATTGEGITWSEPTDAAGRSSVPARPGDVELQVSQTGYRAGKVKVPAEFAGEVLVVLEPTNHLVVRVLDSQGGPLPDISVQLSAEEGLFADPEQELTWGKSIGPGAFTQASWSDLGEEIRLQPDGRGEAGVTGLHPDHEIVLRVLPATGEALHDEVLPPRPPAGRLVREIRIDPASARPLRGIVEDEAGEPIAGARAWLTSGETRASRKSDAAGGFEFPNVQAETVRLHVTMPGYVPWHREELSVPLGGETLGIRLERGQRVEVLVIDELGVPHDALLEVWAEGYSNLFRGRTRDGRAILDALPSVPITVEASLGSLRYRRVHDPAIAELRIEVPAMGSVVAPPDLIPWETGMRFELQLRSQDGQHSVSFTPVRPQDPTAPVALGLAPVGLYEVELRRRPAWRPGMEHDRTPEKLTDGSVDVRAGTANTIRQ